MEGEAAFTKFLKIYIDFNILKNTHHTYRYCTSTSIFLQNTENAFLLKVGLNSGLNHFAGSESQSSHMIRPIQIRQNVWIQIRHTACNTVIKLK